MNREQFIEYTSDEYGIDGEFLWPKYPLFCAAKIAIPAPSARSFSTTLPEF